MIVEDGSGIANANAAITEAYLESYAETVGKAIPAGDVEAGIVRGTAAIDAMHGARFPGERTHGRDQGIAWPRIGAYDAGGHAIASNEMPIEYKKAVAEASLQEMATPGIMNPDDAGGSVVRRKKLGSMEVEYAVSDGSRPAKPTFPVIDGILAPLLGYSSPYFGRAVRA